MIISASCFFTIALRSQTRELIIYLSTLEIGQIMIIIHGERIDAHDLYKIDKFELFLEFSCGTIDVKLLIGLMVIAAKSS